MSAPIDLPPLKSRTVCGVSKSTVQGYLSVLVVIFLLLSQMQLPSIASTQTTHVWIWITWAAAGIAVILKAILAHFQGDATN